LKSPRQNLTRIFYCPEIQEDKKLNRKQRNTLLKSMAKTVCDMCLDDNAKQAQVISIEERASSANNE